MERADYESYRRRNYLISKKYEEGLDVEEEFELYALDRELSELELLETQDTPATDGTNQ